MDWKDTTVLLSGALGMLGSEISQQMQDLAVPVLRVDIDDLDICDRDSVEEFVRANKPKIWINCSAYTAVDRCEEDPQHMQVNGEALRAVADICLQYNTKLVHFSTDYVFSGQFDAPIPEEQATAPLNAYGRGKLIGEEHILATPGLEYLIFRIQWLYGQNGKNFVDTLLGLSKDREELKVVNDQIGRPTSTKFVSQCVLAALEEGLSGIYHLGPQKYCSWYEFASFFLRDSKCKVLPIPSEEYPTPAKRPGFSVLAVEKFAGEFVQAPGFLQSSWKDLVEDYLQKA
ncbi:MAG: dTDP-4-dehydrorhamnose reductase [Spirochaetota bacterium]